MVFKLYTDSEDAWTAMFARMKGATKSIHIEMYIFTADTQRTHDFITLLKEKAQNGVQVILIFDVFGSISLSNKVVKELRDAGAEVRFFRHIFYRTHKKILLIDGKTAFLGGVNITEHARDWKDLQVEVSGSIVPYIFRSFKRTYKYTGGKAEPLKPEFDNTLKVKMKMWLLENMPVIGRKVIKQYYLRKLNEATESIIFITPYFIPSRWMLGAMRNAISRDVKITVLIPENTDFKLANNINKYYAGMVTTFGVNVLYTPGMNHAKAVLIDNNKGLVGSANIDELSFNVNNEIGVFFNDPKFVAELKHVVDTWAATGKPYDKNINRLKWYQALLVPFIRLFQPIL
jgi:cardiolipin synthase